MALVVLVLLGLLAYAPVATQPDSTPEAVALPIATAVPRSAIDSAFVEPLSSGLSVADITENALPSVVRISAGASTGTGFIVHETGLVVTNKHIISAARQVSVSSVKGEEYRGNVIERHPSLDLAYIQLEASRSFVPIAVGDSDKIRVGEQVVAIGFPLGSTLGSEPTVSVGIISAKREGRLQTDASLNPGNSGGPLLDILGQVAGVVVSRAETDSTGRVITGIGFAIPINEVKSGLGGQVSGRGQLVPTPAPTGFPTIGPTPDVEATKSALEAMDTYRRQAELATRSVIEAQQEAERYAASLEATRVAELPTPTPTLPPTATPQPIATPTPTPTPALVSAPTPTPTLTPQPMTPAVAFEQACKQGTLPTLPAGTLGRIRFPEGSDWGVGAVAGMLVGGVYHDDTIFDSNGVSPGGFFGPVLGSNHDFAADGFQLVCVTVSPGYTIEFLSHPYGKVPPPPNAVFEAGNHVLEITTMSKYLLKAAGLSGSGDVVVRILDYQRCVGSAVC